MNLVDVVEQKYFGEEGQLKNVANFKAGDTVAVHAKIKEGSKERIQIFQGTVIATKHDRKANGHFRVRKMSSGIGVERVFPYFSPNVAKVELVSRGKTRRAKLYYLRERTGKAARIAMDYSQKANKK